MRLPYNDTTDESDQRALEYGQYSDETDGQDLIESDDPEVQREINSLNSESRLASLIEGSRDRASGLINDSNKWRESPSERG